MEFINHQTTRKLADFLVTPMVDPVRRAERLRFGERNIVLPAKAAVLAIFVYEFFFSDSFEGLNTIGDMALDPVRRFLLGYVIINIGVMGVYLWMDRLPFSLVNSITWLVNLIDALFVAAMTVVTGGFESVLFWVFPVLIVRNSISIPVAGPQVVLNFLSIGAYVAAVSLYRSIVELDPLSSPVLIDLGREPTAMVMSGQSGQLLLARVLLLALLTACCYGVEVLFDRGLQVAEEAHESAMRQEQLASAGRFAAEIAHRLKNPLAIINNAAFSAQRLLKSDNSGALEKMQMIREEVDRSDRILTELMGYAQLAEGRVERLDLAQMLDDALTQVLPPAAKFEVTVHRHLAVGLPPLLMQRAHLETILVNLLLNAREAMNGRGTLRINIAQADDGSVIIRIADTGPGIPERQRRQIFEPYFTTKEKGTGLGLSIVKHNVELYGGVIELESTLGKGTTFILKFPVKVLLSMRK